MDGKDLVFNGNTGKFVTPRRNMEIREQAWVNLGSTEAEAKVLRE